jgi:entericidin B
MKYLIILASLLTTSVLASACNTMEGLGKDVQQGGEELEDSAERNK